MQWLTQLVWWLHGVFREQDSTILSMWLIFSGSSFGLTWLLELLPSPQLFSGKNKEEVEG